MQYTRWFLTYGFLLAVISVTLSYFYFDIPLINWAHAHDLRQYQWLHVIQQFPEYFPYLAFALIVTIGLRSCWSKISYCENALFLSSISYVMVNFLTKYFKMIFARTWPATWVDNNPSWLTDGVFGFFWFADSAAYRSFPSGHTAAIFAVVVVVCGFYRQLRWLGAIACLMVIVGLIGNYYHFLSDMIAGAYLGSVTGLMVLRITAVRGEYSGS